MTSMVHSYVSHIYTVRTTCTQYVYVVTYVIVWFNTVVNIHKVMYMVGDRRNICT
jgi:hypothetical protein